ncbi:MAG: 4Fe-4S binding protein [Desulfovibrio sp.]|nr:4Fe-4S binding protein [Desulfovibrio sp.]
MDANEWKDGCAGVKVQAQAPASGPREGNVSRSGDVLYLDADRLASKADPDRPLRRNRPDGLGIMNWFVRRLSAYLATEKGQALREKTFKSIMELAARPEKSVANKMLHRLLGTDSKGYTHVHVIPLDIDLTDCSQTVIVPYDLIVAELKDARDIAIMNFCVCRKTMKCASHPRDFGCIFTGVGARRVVELGVARKASLEEAVAHVDRAAELGLMGAADFIEGEQAVWGLKNSEMNECRMICFCCECCYVALNTLKASTRDVSRRFTPVGWTAVVDLEKCMGCRACARHCPQKCISFGSDGFRITEQDACLGCGFCKRACRFGAVSIRQTMPMRASLNEYYLQEARIDDGHVHAPAVHAQRSQEGGEGAGAGGAESRGGACTN